MKYSATGAYSPNIIRCVSIYAVKVVTSRNSYRAPCASVIMKHSATGAHYPNVRVTSAPYSVPRSSVSRIANRTPRAAIKMNDAAWHIAKTLSIKTYSSSPDIVRSCSPYATISYGSGAGRPRPCRSVIVEKIGTVRSASAIHKTPAYRPNVGSGSPPNGQYAAITSRRHIGPSAPVIKINVTASDHPNGGGRRSPNSYQTRNAGSDRKRNLAAHVGPGSAVEMQGRAVVSYGPDIV